MAGRERGQGRIDDLSEGDQDPARKRTRNGQSPSGPVGSAIPPTVHVAFTIGAFVFFLGTPAALDVPASPAGLADGVSLEDRLRSGAAASVEGGRLRIALPSGSSAVFVPSVERFP